MKSIVFFDLGCPLCRRTVNFLHRQDRSHRLQFASLEGKTAHRYFTGKLRHFKTLKTVVFLEVPSGKLFSQGRAVMRILGKLGGVWSVCHWMYQLPFLNFFYRLVATNRSRGGLLPVLKVPLLP